LFLSRWRIAKPPAYRWIILSGKLKALEAQTMFDAVGALSQSGRARRLRLRRGEAGKSCRSVHTR
jgi:hypothetical protein